MLIVKIKVTYSVGFPSNFNHQSKSEILLQDHSQTKIQFTSRTRLQIVASLHMNANYTTLRTKITKVLKRHDGRELMICSIREIMNSRI